jgi:hypothetical protein
MNAAGTRGFKGKEKESGEVYRRVDELAKEKGVSRRSLKPGSMSNPDLRE